MKKIIITLVYVFTTFIIYCQNTYQYDNLNRIKKTTYTNGTTVEYSYDQLGNRTSKVLLGSSTQQPDLLVQNPSLGQSTTIPGAIVTSGCTVTNMGTGSAGAHYLKCYLSTDTIYQISDVEVGSVYNTYIAASGSMFLSPNLTIPSNTNAGSYYILFYADATTLIIETNESNNLKHLPITIINCSNITLNITKTDAGCSLANGTANITANGGTQPYTYNWSNNQHTAALTGLAGGNYTVTISDFYGCSQTSSATIVSNAAPSLSVSSTPSTCGTNNGTATVTASLGIQPYTYLWSNGQTSSTINSLVAGTYTVTVMDATLCAQNTSVIVSSSSNLNVTINPTSPVCGGNNGILSAVVSGGTQPYTFIWSNALTTQVITGLQSGTYSLTVTDAGNCTFVSSINLTSVNNISVNFVTNNTTCGNINGSATATGSNGTAPYTYHWSNGQNTQTATNLAPGAYNITITDANNCSIISYATIGLTLPPSVNITSTQTTCSHDIGTATANVTDGTPVFTYLWNDGQTTQTATELAAGQYSVTVSDASGCTTSSTVIIFYQTSLQPVNLTNGLIAYYPFNGNANDMSGNGNNGTMNGTIQFVNGVLDSSAEFNSSQGDYVAVSNSASFQNLSSTSISLWVKPTSFDLGLYADAESLVSKGWGEVASSFGLYIRRNSDAGTTTASSFDSIKFVFDWGTKTLSSPFYSPNNWYNCVAIATSDTVKLFVDNTLVGAISSTNQIISNSYPIYINYHTWYGGSSSSSRFGGDIDDIKIYNRALNNAEVHTIYNSVAFIPQNGLVAYYPFNGNANDISGNGNNGTVSGATLTTDRFGNANKAYSFDGVNNNIIVPNSSSLNISSNEISISMWIKWQNSDADYNYRGLSKGGQDVGSGYELIVRGESYWGGDFGAIEFDIPTNNTLGVQNTNSFRNQWVHLLSVFNNGVRKIYVNGILSAIDTTSNTSILPNTNDLYLGPRNPINNYAGQLNGCLDDIRIYNSALNNQEIQALYNEGGWNPLNQGLLAYYPFNGNANDESGNGNNGTVNGATLTTDRFVNANKAYNFDGVNDKIYTNINSGFVNKITLCTWVKAGINSSWGGILVNREPQCGSLTGLNYQMNGQNNSFSVAHNSQSNINDANINVADNNWHFIVGVYDGTKSTIYIDNVVNTTSIFTIDTIELNGNFIIGFDTCSGYGESRLFSGKIDDIRIYNRALTPSEISQLYLYESSSNTSISVSLGNDTTICENQSVTLDAGAGFNTYQWSTNETTQTINISNLPSGTHQYSVTVTACTESATDAINIISNPLPANAGLISGSPAVCQGQTSVTYTVPTIANATSYIWTIPAGATGSSSTNSITVNFGSSAVSGNISVVGVNSCGGGLPSNLTISVTPIVSTPIFTLGTTSTRCQGAETVTYGATATNTTGFTYTLDAPSTTAGNSIIAGTGAVTYVAGWSGTSTITASAAGCNGPKTATHTVTITPTVGTPVFTSGVTSTRCQGAGSVTYSATATNSTGITYTLDAPSTTAGNSIIAGTGAVTYVAGWSGTSTITASAAGCNGPVTATHTVTITPTVGTPVFTTGSTSTRCQGAGSTTYTATATNSTGITYTLDAPSTTAGNSIIASTGAVTYVAGWSGTSTITAGAVGCNGPKTAIHTVTITPTVGTPVFTSGVTTTRCQGAGTVTYTATTTNSTGITYTLDAPSTTAGNSIVAGTGAVTYVTGWSGTSIITASAAGCNGPKTATHTVTITPTVGTPSIPTPSAITICQGSANTTFTTVATTATSYNWTVTGIGNIISGTGTTGTVTWTSGFSGTATVSVTANGCNGSSVSASTTVTVLPTPTATISGTTYVCQNDAAPHLTFTNPNDYPVTITYNINAQNQANINVNENSSATITVPTDNAGIFIYNLLSVVYQTAPICSTAITGTAIVAVNPVFIFTENHSICDGETYNWHGVDYTIANTYSSNYTGTFGCDSIYTLHLTVNSVDLGVTLSNFTITADSSANAYQWVDCDNNFSIINGEDNQSFTATGNGYYAVIITQGLCSDTSACLHVTNIGIDSKGNLQTIKVYPNPVTNELILEIEGNTETINFEIYNAIGQAVYKGSLLTKTVVNTNSFATGVYLIKLANGKTLEFKKIVKE